MMPKVSILIPVYNVSGYIERCAISVFEQTLKDVEYIFVDDASPDDSIDKLKKIIEQYPEKKNSTKIIRHERNEGLAAARNTALHESTGEYIAVVDSDDYIEPDMLSQMYETAIAQQADIVVSDMIMEYPGKTFILPDKVPDNQDDIFKEMLLNESSHSFLPDKLIKSSLYKMPECIVINGLNYYEDRYVSLRLYYYAKKIVKINNAFYHYNHTNAYAITKNKTEMHFKNAIQFWDSTDEFLKSKGIYDKYRSIAEFPKIQTKVRLMVDCNDWKLRRKYSDIFIGFEKKYKKNLKSGEKLILWLLRHKLFLTTQFVRQLIQLKGTFAKLK